MWTNAGKIPIFNLCNPCINLEEHYFQEIMHKISIAVYWVGDFNLHYELWESKKKETEYFWKIL